MNPIARDREAVGSGWPQQPGITFDWSSTAAFLAVLCLVLGLQMSPASAATGTASLAPPPAPAVAPVIRYDYDSDVDGDRIDDRLATQTDASMPEMFRSASLNAPPDMVGVELIFRAPVTQDQIDAFLALGGRITYMYKAVSYGWNGRISRRFVGRLPAVMGPTLVHVTGTQKVQWYMDLASQCGRVRPVWRPGFAGHVEGFDGDPDTTIAFIDTGIDGEHRDLAGRCAYWSDLSSEPEPFDQIGHGTMIAGVAVGTGQAAGSGDTVLKYTYYDDYAYWVHFTDHITLPSGNVTLKARAFWKGREAVLDHVVWTKGRPGNDMTYLDRLIVGTSPLLLSNSIFALEQACYAAVLYDPFYHEPMEDVVIVSTVSKYPGVEDGFNTFRGVAPACRWAAVALPAEAEDDELENGISAAIDDLVAHRSEKNIKIVNISGGLLDDDGLPREGLSLRDKINSAVKNGIVVVAAVGNSAEAEEEAQRAMADPARAALAISVGASNDINALTAYSNYGFLDPRPEAGEDYKPDIIAPGGSYCYSTIMSLDSGTADGVDNPDKEPDDYAAAVGTSFSSPFVAGCAALVIEAMERGGVEWDFSSDRHPLYVKMLLCATASETNARRESKDLNPTLERASGGPEGFPAGKDRYEGYGLVNADAAVEAASLAYLPGTTVQETLGETYGDRRVWARTLRLTRGCGVDLELRNPAAGDFDLYLYNAVPSASGTPVLLASSARPQVGGNESLSYTPGSDASALVVVRRVTGAGTFELNSRQAGPPVAQDMSVSAGVNAPLTIALEVADDGSPNPPGSLTYTIASLPQHGRLKRVQDATPIASVPATLGAGVHQVVYEPDSGWTGADSFKFHASDGGTAPFGGRSNTATVTITVIQETTVTYQVADGADDAHALRWGTVQALNDSYLSVGQHVAAMRFRSVDIPQGAHIVRAVLKVRSCSDGLGAAVRTPISAEATDNAAAFDDNGRRVNALAKTNVSQTWNLASTIWKSNTWYESPDIRAVIQEVIDRAGWSANNAMVVICGVDTTASTSRKFRSYDGDPTGAPQLEITYRP